MKQKYQISLRPIMVVIITRHRLIRRIIRRRHLFILPTIIRRRGDFWFRFTALSFNKLIKWNCEFVSFCAQAHSIEHLVC